MTNKPFLLLKCIVNIVYFGTLLSCYIIIIIISLQLEDKTTVIQPEPVGPNICNETWITSDAAVSPTNGETSKSLIETSVPPIAPYKNPKKDLSQIVEKLSQQRGTKTASETVAHISASKFYENVTDRLAAQQDACKEHIIRLEAMENTKYGVFQTVLQSSSSVQMENTDLMKAQVMFIYANVHE
jgi:hypothetical protein